MFSKQEKQKIAEEFEKLVLSFNHPEMPKEKPMFKIHIEGKESWSWADIGPNWLYEQSGSPENPNPWNEVARDVLKEKEKRERESGQN